jgi:hypothetical protein
MKKQEPPDPATPDRFFHALVIMGGSVALGCGGVATNGNVRDSVGTDASANGGARSAGTGGFVEATSGGSVSYGGHPQGGSIFGGSGTGGATNSGGVTNTGGVTFVDGGATCVPEQWECHTGPETECSNYGRGVLLPRGCGCNAARPTRAADCAPGQFFVCRQASTSVRPGADGAQVVSTLPFECSCVTTPYFCKACEIAFGPMGGGEYECSQPGLDHGIADVLCGCTVIYLH